MQINLEDEIIRDTLIARDGEVVNPRIRELLGAAALDDAAAGQPAGRSLGRSDDCLT